jgi:hypothetical protein
MVREKCIITDLPLAFTKRSYVYKDLWSTELKTNSVALSPQANYTDWATATSWRNLVPTFADREVSCGQSGGSPTVVHISFLDRNRYFLSSISSFILTRAEWTLFQTHCYSENLIAPGIEPGTSGLRKQNYPNCKSKKITRSRLSSN